jgi:hypothetical protein
VRGGGLLQVGHRQHAVLRGAWRRQTAGFGPDCSRTSSRTVRGPKPASALNLRAHSTNAVNTRAASRRLLTTVHPTAARMAGAGAVNSRAAPRRLLEAVRCAARRMAGAGGASTRAAPGRLKAIHNNVCCMAVPARGLHQVRSRGQALPALGLPQGSSYDRHAALYPAWRWQALQAGGLYQVCRSS